MAETVSETYEHICKSRFDEIITKLNSMDQRLFRGNGEPPINVQLAEHEIEIVRLQKWRTAIISFISGATLIALGVFLKAIM